MADKNTRFELKDYIDLYELMQLKSRSHEENRSFGLSHKELLEKPRQLLALWVEKHRHILSQPSVSERLVKILSGTTLFLLILSFILGVFSGIGLLKYSGSEPVNLIYFLAAVFLLPLVTMTMTLIAMLRANQSESLLVHLSPAYWMERILALLPNKSREMISNFKVTPLIGNWIVIRRSQELALAFSLGLFLALLGIVASRDIAFSWSTTLQVSPEEFHYFLSMIALPWREFLPQAVPSLELIEKSHYFRLGGRLGSDMISHAELLGQWWKFLAMTTLFYALFLRFLLFLLASVGMRKAIDRAALSLDGVRDLLREMQEPLITTQALTEEKPFGETGKNEITTVKQFKKHYSAVIGWALDYDTILLQNEREEIGAEEIFEAGGLHSLEEDRQVINAAKGDILIYVKAWEPPTMDFIDFLTSLSEKARGSVLLYPLGTPQRNYRATDSEFAIWARKVSVLKKDNVRMKR